jgi:hypothetical protein
MSSSAIATRRSGSEDMAGDDCFDRARARAKRWDLGFTVSVLDLSKKSGLQIHEDEI